MSDPQAHVPASPSLVSFVLANVRIRTNVCTRQTGESGYRLLPRVVPDYNLIFVTRGAVTWHIAGEAHPMTPGEAVLVPPGVRHEARGSAAHSFGSVHWELTLPGGQDALQLLVPPTRQTFAPGSRLERYLQGFLDEFDRASFEETTQMTPGWSRLIALELLRENAREGRLRQPAVDPLVIDLLDELRRRIDKPTTLGELARRSGFSPQHLNRLFGRVLGVTPLRYLARMRMERAAELLEADQLTVQAIALRVGYTDPYYFSRVFREHFDRSPQQYRDALQRSDGSDSPAGDSRDPFTS